MIYIYVYIFSLSSHVRFMVYFAITPQLHNFTPPFGDAGAFFPSGVFGAPSFGFFFGLKHWEIGDFTISDWFQYVSKIPAIVMIYDRYMMISRDEKKDIFYGCQNLCPSIHREMIPNKG